MPTVVRLGLAAVALLAACDNPKPTAPVVELARTTDTVHTPYAEIADGIWLDGDRWAVVAPLDVTVGIIQPKAGQLTQLSGAGSGELRNPANVFRSADTLWVSDWGLRRTTLWTLDGRLIRTIKAPELARGALPRARDDAGRFYMEVPPRPRADGSGNRDSAAVVRGLPDFQRLDTIARLAPLDLAEVQSDAGRRFERRVFSGTDRWGVLPDGSLWVARVYANRVDWRAPDGKWTEGEPLPDRVLEVTRYDRELFLRKFPPELRGTAEQLPFAAVKSPFEAGFTAPDGLVWLEKSRAPADSARRYHVVNRQGTLLREVRLPGQGRIVAVGDDAVLVAERLTLGTRFVRFTPPESRRPVTSQTPEH
jgi:hypothetical protein